MRPGEVKIYLTGKVMHKTRHFKAKHVVAEALAVISSRLAWPRPTLENQSLSKSMPYHRKSAKEMAPAIWRPNVILHSAVKHQMLLMKKKRRYARKRKTLRVGCMRTKLTEAAYSGTRAGIEGGAVSLQWAEYSRIWRDAESKRNSNQMPA